jgi:hypothetical protein
MRKENAQVVDFSALRKLEMEEQELTLLAWLTNLPKEVTTEREQRRATALKTQEQSTVSAPDALTVLDSTRLIAKRLFKSQTNRTHELRPRKPYQGFAHNQLVVLSFTNAICWDVALVRRLRKLTPYED